MNISESEIDHEYMFGILFFILSYVTDDESLKSAFAIFGILYVIEYVVLLIIDIIKEIRLIKKEKKSIR